MTKTQRWLAILGILVVGAGFQVLFDGHPHVASFFTFLTGLYVGRIS